MSDSEKATPSWQQLYAAARGFGNLAFFAERFFPHHCKAGFCPMHHEFFDLMKNPLQRGQRLAIAAPRGYGKTTLFVMIKILHALCYQTEPYILILCQSNSEAKERVTQIADELAHNPFLHAVFGPQIVTSTLRGQKQKLVTLSGLKVEALSVGMQIRGKKHGSHRPTYIILDDIEKLANTYNAEQREKLAQWFQKDVMKAVETDGTTNITLIGTLLHTDSLLANILNNAEWDGYRYQAIITEATHTDLWDQYKTLLVDLQNPNRQHDADAFFNANEAHMMAGAHVLWPEQEPYKRLVEQRIFGGEGAFRSEKQNDPFDPDRKLFHMPSTTYFTVKGDTIHTHQQQIPLNSLSIRAYHDPCLGTDPRKLVGDYAAIVVVGKSPHGVYYLLDAFIDKATPDEQIEAAYQLWHQWKFSTIAVESNGFQKLLAPRYHDTAKQHHIPPLHITEVVNTRPKLERIASLQPLVCNGHLQFNEALPKILINQFAAYPTTHDDGPDAVAGIIAQFEQSPTPTTTLVHTHPNRSRSQRQHPSLSNRAVNPRKH